MESSVGIWIVWGKLIATLTKGGTTATQYWVKIDVVAIIIHKVGLAFAHITLWMIVMKVGSKSHLNETISWSCSLIVKNHFLGTDIEDTSNIVRNNNAIGTKSSNIETRRKTTVPTMVFLFQELTHVRKLVHIWIANKL